MAGARIEKHEQEHATEMEERKEDKFMRWRRLEEEARDMKKRGHAWKREDSSSVMCALASA